MMSEFLALISGSLTGAFFRFHGEFFSPEVSLKERCLLSIKVFIYIILSVITGYYTIDLLIEYLPLSSAHRGGYIYLNSLLSMIVLQSVIDNIKSFNWLTFWKGGKK